MCSWCFKKIQQSQTKRQETSINHKKENSLVKDPEREMNASRIPMGVAFQAKFRNDFICRNFDHPILQKQQIFSRAQTISYK